MRVFSLLAVGLMVSVMVSGMLYVAQTSSPLGITSDGTPKVSNIAQHRYYIFEGEPSDITPNTTCPATVGLNTRNFIFLLQDSPPSPESMTYGLGPVASSPLNNTANTSNSSNDTGSSHTEDVEGFCLRSAYTGPTAKLSSVGVLLYLCCNRGTVSLTARLYDLGNNNSSQPWHFLNPVLLASTRTQNLTLSAGSLDCYTAEPVSLALEPVANHTLNTGDILGLQLAWSSNVMDSAVTDCQGLWSEYQSSASSVAVTATSLT